MKISIGKKTCELIASLLTTARYDRRGKVAWNNGGESVAYALWSVVLERMLTGKGVKISGLLVILVKAKQKNLIVAVKPLINNLIATSKFKVFSNLYRQILNIVDEP